MENNSKSIWEDYKIDNKNDEQKFNNDDIDVLIIGGGISGISSAYFFMNENLKVTLVDKASIGMGVTSKTTAKINYLQGTIYQTLEKSFNQYISKQYFNSQIDAINLIKDIILKNNIKCDLKECDSYIFTKEKKNIKKILKEKELLEKWNVKCETVNNLPIHFPIELGIKVKETYTFHPLKFIASIKTIIEEKINIFENVMVLDLIHNNDYIIAKTDKGDIKAKNVIIACHYPFFIFPSIIPVRTQINREYVNCAKYDISEPFTAISIDSTLHSIRFYNNYIIYGSNKHKLTNKIDYQKNYDKSRYDFKRLFSKEPEYTWMNQDLFSNDYLPIIGIANKNHKNLFIATGYNAWGMTNGVLAGKIISDLILKKENRYINLFNPSRINMSSIVNSLVGIANYSKIYIQTAFKKNPVFYNDHVNIIKIDGKYYGVYYDYYGKKHIVYLKCPHMKCNVVFNNEEKTWDCPCHGSRFDIDGNVIEGPANYTISINK